MSMILILGVVFFTAIIMFIAGLVEEVKGLWISAFILLVIAILTAIGLMFGISTM